MSKHSRKRAFERYNLELNRKDEQYILGMLKNGNFIPLKTSESDKHKKFAYITYQNIPMKILYYKSNKGGVSQIITVYPFDVDEFNKLLAEEKEQYNYRLDNCIKFLKSNGYIVYKRKEKGIDKQEIN